MNTDRKVPDVDETPEYPLPSPTDSLSRDQRPPDDDDAGVEQVPSDDDDIEADPEDWDDGAGEPAITKRQ
ncbi:hypothetical protein PSJE_06430 [Pseudomonas jessenii]|uniref:Uncharacterized protein n=2 Tax=Pseudomonas TaxID=286 RepID=A0A231GNE9_PSEJE|nr:MULTISPECIES: hypothetical protein [Pseudomonas]OXR38130.1 hypothetical protein PSJE_06430 [Pseudomonas jessenii]SEB99739.1 hypothetical protein SAMN04490187_2770 [Pseudomonas jessenii]VVP75638.1 hypothetical protein PS922_01313 [Pseudomonas fluorescens]